MKHHIATALAVVAFAATGAVFACEYSAMDDGVAAAPADASKVPVAAACEGSNCAVKPDKLRMAPKPANKVLVIAAKAPAATQSPTSR